MKIIVRPSEGPNLMIPFPNTLIGTVFCSRIGRKYVKKALASQHVPQEKSNSSSESWIAELPDEAIIRFQKALKKTMKQYHHLPLVELKASDGTYVKIEL